ncbi:iron ABC transporter ATP-binding protein [Sphingobacterium wenxiniae]|uniref:Iron complex transport system ATP-binding protein n=1 Tax=Sphingobacterium wenxiniae TaxID=683125 RepID=A0A1I6NR91_9SPHI|nr:ATP-binding cassette domain-containing protein [Sphingobacterium wenxiniae]SFS30415.1 iron complex transport system ATP-binding protein [Sphingobacterium wenxiniae]
MENQKENKLVFQGIVKEYGKKKVVDGLDGAIKDNAITSLIGPNGAGKSTLLSILSRLLKQDGGDVFFMEQKLQDYKSSELAKKLSILKQSNQMDVKLTVRDLVAFGRFPYSKGRLTATDWQKVEEAIAFSDLQDFADAYIDELSGGQRQRAFIAMIIAQDTDYILLDEPLNNLDMKHSVHVMKTLRRLVDELGKTVVIVIHEINFAAQYSDYIIALKDGKICYNDTTHRVINPHILHEIFGIAFDIIEKNDRKICNYFNL